MKRILLTLTILATATLALRAQTQLSNSDFEQWRSANEPMGWNSFESAKTTFLTSFGKRFVQGNTTATEGRTGKAVQIVSSEVLGTKANGNLTTGRINMGSATPTSKDNYNFTDLSSAQHRQRFTGLPDSVSFYATYTRGESGTYGGQAAFTLHNRVAYKVPGETPANVARYRVAEALAAIPPTATWTRFVVSMDYTGVALEEGYMLASFSTNPEAGGSSGDVLRIDDVAFVYNAGLKALSYDGVAVPHFDTDSTHYVLTATYDSTKLTAQANGRSATIKQRYDEATALLTIRVEGGNIAEQATNFTEYTVQFQKDVPTHVATITASVSATSDVFTLAGQRVRHAVPTATATVGLPKGIYLVGGTKVVVR